MSLESVVTKLETEVREGIQNAVNWGTEVLETHLPGAIADVKAVAGSTLFKAIEDAVLTPSEEALVAELVSKLPSLRSGQPQPSGPPAGTPAGGAQAEGTQSAA